MNKFSYINNANAAFIEELYESYKEDPESVDFSWQKFFEGYEFAESQSETEVVSVSDKEVAVMKFINAYRARGHLIAKTNPIRPRRPQKADLELEYFGLAEEDLDTEFDVGDQIHIGKTDLRSIAEHLEKTYCSSIGCEYRNIRNSRTRVWLHEHMEPIANQPQFDKEDKIKIFDSLVKSVGFESFLGLKYISEKRFSLEGIESFIPALNTMFNVGSNLGVKEFVVGMAHRGRLNVLSNLFGKSYERMFNEFENTSGEDYSGSDGDGDVKYHHGYSANIEAEGGPLHLCLVSNPSHLEAVNPVVTGQVRAKGQNYYNSDYNQIVPVLVHGDAAIAGQGIVYEIANMRGLEGYGTGGTIHIVLNNQIGFTADYKETRSSLYCTDIAKVTESPVFHVNADDVEAVCHVMQMAIQLRQLFNVDVYIDILGYRRHGHNEGDDPQFTQPLLYNRIKNHPNVLKIYKQQLIEEGVMTEQECDERIGEFRAMLEKELAAARAQSCSIGVTYLSRAWREFREATAKDFEYSPDTGVEKATLDKILNALVDIPQDFNTYKGMRRFLEKRKKVYDSGKVDWGTGESLAYGSLLLEGKSARISGQDCRRGTFSHRHAVLVDNIDETKYVPLNHISPNQKKLEVYNSHLSEYGVMGFEFGYSQARPHCLTIWEAQFGDFANGAQIIIDQFLSPSESKWERMSGMVLFLPHGYEGQGPEHSSARVERFLGLCAKLNMIVVNPTTPANMFHLLRRQMLVDYRKPLVVFTPKSLLRHPKVQSDISELEKGSFKEIIDDNEAVASRTNRVLLCTGKVYYELLAKKEELRRDDVAIVRVEQLYPLPVEQKNKLIKRYKKAKDWIWVQEEPVNMGAWHFIRDHFKKVNLDVVARAESASPATGSKRMHKEFQAKLIDKAFK